MQQDYWSRTSMIKLQRILWLPKDTTIGEGYEGRKLSLTLVESNQLTAFVNANWGGDARKGVKYQSGMTVFVWECYYSREKNLYKKVSVSAQLTSRISLSWKPRKQLQGLKICFQR